MTPEAQLRSLPRGLPGKLVRTLEIALWTFAGISLCMVICMYADMFFFQHSAKPPTAPPAGTHVVERDPSVTPGTPIARLEIPRLGLDVVVAEGSASTVLRRAVGHLEQSAWPGEGGNVVLAGHRDTFFRGLADVREGDVIVLESEAGKQTYEVEWIRIVEPTDVDVLSQSRHPALTLITCYPFQYVGQAPQRFVVRARGSSASAESTSRSSAGPPVTSNPAAAGPAPGF